jgi:Uma2 family endonuclease
MHSPSPGPKLSVEDYLVGEDGAEQKHEYIDGEIYAMGGASDRHGLIASNLVALLRPQVRGSGCQLFASDMKVRLRLANQDIFYYPDLLLSCDPNDRETYFRAKPCAIIEVLSSSTDRIDRREKLFAYTTLPSLQDYLLIAQDERRVWHHRRAKDWAPEVLTEGGFKLDCLDAELALPAIYEEIEGLG